MSVVSVVLWSVLQAAPAPKWESVSIPTPHVHQEPDFCGEAE